MSADWLKTGARCRTKPRLEAADGLSVKPMYVENRRGRQSGLLLGPAKGHGGAVWLVQHGPENRVAAYWVSELTHVPPVVEAHQWALFE